MGMGLSASSLPSASSMAISRPAVVLEADIQMCMSVGFIPG
jgi:hypothetical protein